METKWGESFEAAALGPIQSAPLPNPNVSQDQDAQKNQHLHQPEQAEDPELNRPGKQEDGLHVEDDEQDGDDVEANRVTAPGIRFRVDAALVGLEFTPPSSLEVGRISLPIHNVTMGKAAAIKAKIRIGPYFSSTFYPP